MKTGKSVIAIAASMMVLSALRCSAQGQDLPTKLGDITQPEATPIPLTPRRHALPITQAENAEGGIVWGSGHEVQSGLRARLWTDGKNVGRFIFDVYLRNKTDRSLTVECPGNAGTSAPTDAGNTTLVQADKIYCSPIMEDKHGKLIDVGVRQGTDQRLYKIAPGQVILISHWMLQTRSNQAELAPRKGETLVAYVSPGTYLMSCDVKAKWEDQSSELRTGKVPFKVLETDVEGSGGVARGR
jgi:hypothetical protein